VDRVVTPLPVHAYHPNQGSRRLGRFSQHATRWKRYANQAAFGFAVYRCKRNFETIASHRTTTFVTRFSLILCLNRLTVNEERYLNAQLFATPIIYTYNRAPGDIGGIIYPMPTPRVDPQPLTAEQAVQLHRDLTLVEERLQDIAILMRVSYGDESQPVIRADEIAAALQRLKWELERTKVPRHTAASENTAA
jgi:hypothetical protein